MSINKSKNIIFSASASEPGSSSGTVYVDDGTNTTTGSVKIRINTSGTYVDSANEPEVAIIAESQTATTNGGTYTSGANTTRVLNTTVLSASWLSLSSNRFTIDGSSYPGVYSISWRTPFFSVNEFYSFLVQDPAGTPTDAAYGDSNYAVSSGDSGQDSFGKYIVTLTASTTYEIQARATTTKATNGLGTAHNITGKINYYTQVLIIRYH